MKVPRTFTPHAWQYREPPGICFFSKFREVHLLPVVGLEPTRCISTEGF